MGPWWMADEGMVVDGEKSAPPCPFPPVHLLLTTQPTWQSNSSTIVFQLSWFSEFKILALLPPLPVRTLNFL